MFSKKAISGKFLPPKTLCLTFDDGPGATSGTGPGPKTAQIAKFLESQRVSAAFFLTGRHAASYPEALEAILRHGHIAANHTFNHYQLTDLLANPNNIVTEIIETEKIIGKYSKNGKMYFRPPYGVWTSEIAVTLNQNLKSNFDYLGPYGYEIDGSDWSYWERQQNEDECAQNYLNIIERIGRGIILMHDSTADDDHIRQHNRTYETLKILIPELISRGYTFIGLDELQQKSSKLAMVLDFCKQKMKYIYYIMRKDKPKISAS